MNELSRRDAVKAVAVGAVTLGGAVALGEDRKPKTTCHPYRIAVQWGTVASIKPVIDDSVLLTPGNPGRLNAVGFLLSGSTTALGTEDAALRATTLTSFTVPVSLPEELPKDHNGNSIATLFIGYNHFIRGTLSKHKDARVVIIADIAGTTKVFEFPFGVEVGDAAGTQIDPDFKLELFSLMNVRAEGDPQKYPKLPPYAASLLVSVERRNTQAAVHVAIDGLDTEATYSAPDMPIA